MRITILVALTLLASSQIIVNLGCNSFGSNGTCLGCSVRFYMDAKGICQPVSASCKTYNNSTGACTSCYSGFELLQSVCIQNPNPQDPNCANVTNEVCVQCSKGFYLQNGSCILVDPLCKTFDFVHDICIGCYNGYQLVNSSCAVAQGAAGLNGCALFNGSVCLKCSSNYYANGTQCVQVDTNCKTFNSTNGNCLSCFDGWNLANTTCVVAPVGTSDPFCKTFQNLICVACSNGYYFNQNNICTQVDPFCKSFNYTTLTCAACYSGFTLVNNTCTFNQNKPAYDVNCNSFNTNGQCINCSKGYYFNTNNVCTQIDPSCQNFSLSQLVCTTCYSGYALTNGSCVRTNTSESQLPNCAQQISGVCVQCVTRAYYDISNNCVMVSDLCNAFNTFNGFCTSCFGGYALNNTNGVCFASSNANCNKSDPNTNMCTGCVNGYYLNQGSCNQIDPECQTFNFTSLKCIQCYNGYTLNAQSACGVSQIITATIANCVAYDSTGQNCQQCYNSFYLSNNQCILADPLCKSFDPTSGACLTCYSSFTLTTGKCIFQ